MSLIRIFRPIDDGDPDVSLLDGPSSQKVKGDCLLESFFKEEKTEAVAATL